MIDRPGRPERQRGAPIVEPKPAATVVLLRPSSAGYEALLTKRAASLRFGADMFVFPGGRIDPDDAGAAAAAVRETAEETGIELAVADLIPLSRWVTPAGLPSRYDARFFAAIVGPDADVVRASDEVAEWRWLAPAVALTAMAEGELDMWQPTVVTLQQLDGLPDRRAIEAAFAPEAAFGAEAGPGGRAGTGDAPAGDPEASIVEAGGPDLRRLWQPWAGGVEGRFEPGWIAGRHEWVIVNPADPTGATTEAVLAAAAGAGARLAGIAITDLAPRHHAGVEMFAAGLDLPVVGGIGASRQAPYPLLELRPGDRVPFGDVELVAGEAPGSKAGDRARGGGPAEANRPERLIYEGPGWRLAPGLRDRG